MPDIAILHGCEVDILPDGRLDFPDRVLEQFDIVLASLHHRAEQSPDELLRRYIEAMRHPLVTIITHPTNRMIPNNPGYDLDYDRLFEAAVETGTCLEIDGAPGHLDMDSALARRAVAAGRHRHRGLRRASRGRPRAADGAGHRDGVPRVGRAATRAQHAAAGRHPRRHRAKARDAGDERADRTRVKTLVAERQPSPPSRSCSITPRSCPGLDFGDTASFQTVAGSAIVSPRDGYPLYFAIARAVVPLFGGDPAHALNLTTAIESAAACGVLTLLAAELSGSVLAGMASALLFAVSYTFWSQSVIAEVYGLHMLCVSLALWLLLRWAARPTLTRLAVFFAVVRAGLRQSPLDDSAAARLHVLPAGLRAGRLAVDAPASRDRARRPARRGRRPAVRVESAHAVVRRRLRRTDSSRRSPARGSTSPSPIGATRW